MLDNPYQVLGVSQDASEAEIKKAYHKAALMYHPDRQAGRDDRNKEEAVEKFGLIAEAHEILTDPVKRYDWRQKNESCNGETKTKPTTKTTTPPPKPPPATPYCHESPRNRERSASPFNSRKWQSHPAASPPPSPMRSPRTSRTPDRSTTSPRRNRHSRHTASPSPSTMRSPRASVRSSTSPAPRRKRHSSHHAASPSPQHPKSNGNTRSPRAKRGSRRGVSSPLSGSSRRRVTPLSATAPGDHIPAPPLHENIDHHHHHHRRRHGRRCHRGSRGRESQAQPLHWTFVDESSSPRHGMKENSRPIRNPSLDVPPRRTTEKKHNKHLKRPSSQPPPPPQRTLFGIHLPGIRQRVHNHIDSS